jgi:metal-sulfur cluster biosynthetic enzyme
MPTDDLTPGFEIESAALDAEEIMQEIRARLRARRDEARARGLDWEAYVDGLYPVPSDAVFSRDLHEAVRHLSLEHDRVSVEMALTGMGLPLVGGLAQRVRAALHELVLFYVNRLATRQTRVNYQASRAMALLIRELEAEIRDLRARIETLEAANQEKA